MDFVIPDSQNIRGLNFFLLNSQKNHPEWFYEDSHIVAAYGVLHPTIFMGGRNFSDTPMKVDDIKNTINRYNEHGVQYRYTFTNLLLKAEHLNDNWGNIQLKLSERYDIGVICASDELIDYMKKNYSKVDLISSVTKKVFSKSELLELLCDNTYKYVVINTVYNNDLSFIPSENRKKCEILINDCCPPLCKFHQECYLNNSREILGEARSFEEGCKNPMRINHKSVNLYDDYLFMNKIGQHLSRQDVEDLAKQGFNMFKIEGRGRIKELVALWYSDYLIKPEYKKEFILKALFNKEMQ